MKTILKKVIVGVMSFALVFSFSAGLAKAATPVMWNMNSNWHIAFDYMGTPYTHSMALGQTGGTLNGSGGYPVMGPQSYTWVITSGSVSGNSVNITADYTAGPDAVTPQTTMTMIGTIDWKGHMSGTWSDNYAGGSRGGTWMSTRGRAMPLGALVAEDFGVMDFSGVAGYSAGFALTGATFDDTTSVVMKLYSGNTLLQKNTSTAKVAQDITGNQISSPFDVFGSFNYVSDGYWVNQRRPEYGQNLIPTKVVAIVTLSNGKVLTAENNILVGDPQTIFPEN